MAASYDAHKTTRTWVMTVTPFKAKGSKAELDEDALRAHLRMLADEGIGVFLGSYGSGEGRVLDRDEVRTLYRIGVEELAGRVPFAAAALGLSATSEIIERAHEAHDLGVEAVQIYPPLAGPPSIAPLPGEIDDFYEEILDAVRKPVVVSNELLMVGYGLDPEWMDRLLSKHDQIIGVNWTDSNPASLARVMQLFGKRTPVRVGLTAQLPLALALGAQGTVSFEANVAPALCRSVTDAFTRGDFEAFARNFRHLMALNLVLARFMTPRSVKAALAHQGRSGSALRRPYRELDAGSRAALGAELDALGAPGFAAPKDG